MATIAPQSATFKALVADLYGDRTPNTDVPCCSSDRQLYRETVTSVVDRAKAAMNPALHGRIDKAHILVVAGDVELLPDGKAQVASQSNGQAMYYVVNGVCSCKDFAQAPEGYCKHRLGAAIARRVQQALHLAEARLAVEAGCFIATDEDGTPCHAVSRACPGHSAPAPSAALPKAPASVNVRLVVQGREVQWTLRDTDESRVFDRLTTLLQRFPVETQATPATPATPPAATPPGQAVCPVHDVAMKLNSNTKGTWYSHKTAAGTWCKGK